MFKDYKKNHLFSSFLLANKIEKSNGFFFFNFILIFSSFLLANKFEKSNGIFVRKTSFKTFTELDIENMEKEWLENSRSLL